MGDTVAPAATGRTIAEPQPQTLYGVPQDESVQGVGDNLDEGIVGHEVGVGVESLAPVTLQQLKIADEVYHQKKHEEKARQRHDDLLSDR